MGAIYLARHGQASFGADDYDELSETGHVQSTALGEALRTRIIDLDAVWSGTQRRHKQTADRCLAAMGWAGETRFDPAFNEFDAEDLIAHYDSRYHDRRLLRQDIARAPHPRRAYQELYEKAVQRWCSNPEDESYTETWKAFCARCSGGVREIARVLGKARTGLVFTSGGPITVVCQALLGLSDDQAWRVNVTIANCSVTKVIYSDRAMYLSTLNEHAHFEGAQSALITYR